MKLHKFEPYHYEEVVKWWTKHGHPVLPMDMLSPFGLICENDSELVAASFIYLVGGCNAAQIAWTTTNPSTSIYKRYEGVDLCIKGLLGLAKQYHKTNVLCLTSSNGLKKIMNRNGLKDLQSHNLHYGSLGVL